MLKQLDKYIPSVQESKGKHAHGKVRKGKHKLKIFIKLLGMKNTISKMNNTLNEIKSK